MRSIPRFLGGSIGHELQSDKRVGVCHHLAGIYVVVDRACRCPTDEDSSVAEGGGRNTEERFEPELRLTQDRYVEF